MWKTELIMCQLSMIKFLKTQQIVHFKMYSLYTYKYLHKDVEIGK